MDIDLARVPGVAETALTPELLDRLPDEAPAAPWKAQARAILWWARPDRGARAALHEVLPAAVGPDARPVLTIGAMLTYTDTPVGPYSEVLGLVVLRRGATVFGHVPFIAVDSPASVVAGRANWALPKTIADFEGEPVPRTTMSAHASTWRIRASSRAYGPALPGPLLPIIAVVQAGPDGGRWSVRVRGRGRIRLARVDVRIDATPSLADWFPSGRCTGILSTALTGYIPPATHHNRRI